MGASAIMTYSWGSEQSVVFANPRLPHDVGEATKNKLVGTYKGHVWLATSGSTAQNSSEIKWVALSKPALLASAAAVNAHLHCTRKDVWINPLPGFHVGGLGINARAYLAGSQVVDFYSHGQGKWDPMQFYKMAVDANATLSALVPTQVYDLISLGLTAPNSLRAIVVGGGALQPALHCKASEMGWKLLPSYGLTECASQVATAELYSCPNHGSPPLHLLSNVAVKVGPEGTFHIKSPSLLTAYAYTTGEHCVFHDPKVAGWFPTEDRGSVDAGVLQVFGRTANFFKIGGESVDFGRLEGIAEEVKISLSYGGDIALVPVADQRLGHAIHLAYASACDADIQPFIDGYNQRVMPFERIRKTHRLPHIPRSPLNKLLRQELQALIT